MKKLFKKSIACLIAVLMVVSTMPFTALTVQAADTSALLSAMQSFEAKMDGSVYTNMDTAYTAYVAASKAYDAAYYGGDASVDVTTPATNLNNAVSQMTKTTLSAYTANNSTVPTFGSGDNGTVANSYVNLLYTGQGTKSTVGVEDTGNVRYTFQVGYNNTVMMYDGTAPRTRVMYMCQVPGKAASGNRFRNPMSCYPTTGSGKSDDLGSLYLVDKWKGGYNDTWNYPTQYNSGTYTFGHNSSTASAGRQIGSSWSGANPSKWFGYSNILEFNSNYNWNGSYLASFANVWWASWSGDNAKTDLLTDDSSTSIYVINYKPLKDAITADANKSARENVASYKEGGLSTYLAGCLLAANLNPNSYSYSTNLAGQVSQCASDISIAVTKFTTAPTADNASNYPALRNAFNYSGELTGFNNATYSVRDAYNGGVNNGFTQASYDNFKAKYEAAQNVMKAVATSGYVNDGIAGKAATELSTAFNALQHEHSFTGAYVNNNDGTHSQKCAFYDKCATMSTGVAHSYTSQVTTQATCTTAGVTTYTCACGDSYTKDEPAATGHSLTETVAKDATCTEAGNSAYWTCSTCNKMFSDAEATTEIEEVPTISATGHSLSKVEEVPSTCTVEGTEAYWTCSACKKMFSDEQGKNEISAPGKLPLAKHSYTMDKTPATCTEASTETYTCSSCGYSYSTHDDAATGHSLTETAANDATCTEDGNSAYWTCSTCKKMFSDAEATTEIEEVPTISATGHSLSKVEEVPSTCTVEGTEAYWTCSACNKMFSDEQGKNEISAPGKLPLAKHSYTMDKTPATCTEASTETYICSSCGYSYSTHDDAATGHDYEYTKLDADNHKVTCSRCDYEAQAPHSFDENNTCKDCEYKKVTIDRSAYDNAVTDYNETITDSNYAAKYTAESRTAYQKAVAAAKIDDFTSQPAINAATSAILEAKTMLCLANIEINVYVAKEDGTSNSVDTITRPYGTKVTINVADKLATNQMISKWTIETKETSVTTKLSTVESAIEIVATEPTDVYVHVVESKSTEIEPVVYSKVSFISKNGAVSSVEYVKNGETFNTDKVEGVKIPFYKFIGWSKASVTGTGEDIEVKAIYEFIGEEVNMCTVHYKGTSTKYAYDKFVYIYGAENDKLALSTTNDESGIITYLNENAFYAPHVDEIYVIEVDTQKASIGITGTYFLPANEKGKKTFAFNCKMFLPEDCELIEAGAILKTATATKKAKAEKISARGEYTIKVTSSTAEYVEGKAYLTYKDTNDNHLYTIYTDAQTITEA